MKVIRADKMGFCFGVERAYRAIEALHQQRNGSDGKPTILIGDIVHNKSVVERVKSFGIERNDYEYIPEKARVIIRTHGETREVYEKLVERGNEIIDLVCPIVTKVRIRGNQLLEEGAEYVVLIGKRAHPEVRGNSSWIERCYVVEDESDLESLPPAKTIGVVSQTTFDPSRVKELTEKLKQRFEKVMTADTICPHTGLNQQTSIAIAPRCDVMLVIGDPHSSNSKTLYQKVKQVNPNTYFIHSKDDLEGIPLSAEMTVGITAGASTPDWIIDQIERTLLSRYGRDSDKEAIPSHQATVGGQPTG